MTEIRNDRLLGSPAQVMNRITTVPTLLLRNQKFHDGQIQDICFKLTLLRRDKSKSDSLAFRFVACAKKSSSHPAGSCVRLTDFALRGLASRLLALRINLNCRLEKFVFFEFWQLHALFKPLCEKNRKTLFRHFTVSMLGCVCNPNRLFPNI